MLIFEDHQITGGLGLGRASALKRVSSSHVWSGLASINGLSTAQATGDTQPPPFARGATVPVRLEFPIFSLNPRLRPRCVAPDVRRHAMVP